MTNQHVQVRVDLSGVWQNAIDVRRRTGVDVIAVLKADAYGVGAVDVARALQDVASAFYFYDLTEVAAVRDAGVTDVPAIVLRGDEHDAASFLAFNARPVVWTKERAVHMKPARPILAVDTGQQRFGCHADEIETILQAGKITEALTHAVQLSQVETFDRLTRGYNLRRHAAGSALLDRPEARFDAVRPGLALYENAVTVSTKLIDARESKGPAGYTGFISRTGSHGVIPCGYAHGLRAGPRAINGQRREIVEIGMQTAFVEIDASDRTGDEVELLGAHVSLADVSACWKTTPQEALLRLCGLGVRVSVN